MSVEEDTELRDLVSQTLETNGCLAKIRAQLRAGVFFALDEDECKKEPFLNNKVKGNLESLEGRIMFCLVREFLEYFNLEFTISVYDLESYMGLQYYYEGRNKIVQDLGIPLLDEKSTSPLLLQLIQIAQLKSNTEGQTITSEKLLGTTCDDSSSINEEGISILQEDDNKSITLNICHKSVSEELDNIVLLNTNKLNETFDLSSMHRHIFKQDNILLNNMSNLNSSNIEAVTNSKVKSNPVEKDDTYDDTSSIAEDRDTVKEDQVDVEKSSILSGNSSVDNEKRDQSVSDLEFSPPVVKDGKLSKFDLSFDKLKLSPQKSEKLKAKNSLSSLSDLPPLPTMNKQRCNDMLLPSLYSKEFKEKSNCKDIEKMFDLNSLDNYEEDFMSGSEAEFVQKKMGTITSDKSDINDDLNKLTNDSQSSGEVNNKDKSNDNADTSKIGKEINDSGASSITSDDFEFNSHVKDILNST